VALDPLDPLVAAVGAAVGPAGFERRARAADFVWFVREERGAVLHVQVQLQPPSRWLRVLARGIGGLGPPLATVNLGVIHPVVAIAFVHPVPDRPLLPVEGHVATRIGTLRPDGLDHWYTADATDAIAEDVVTLGLPWLDQYADPRRALRDGVVTDPFVALEMAAVVDDREAGLAAAQSAQALVATVTAGRRRELEQRRRIALDRLLSG
jgi:hypothetical protein